MFPTMVLQILACKKPNIERYMLLQLERLLRYEKTHPDVLETIALNCAYLDEEDIEFLNALMGRLTSTHQTRSHETYLRASGLLDGLHDLTRQLDALALSGADGGDRKQDMTEHEKLRLKYAGTGWEDTNVTARAWLLRLGLDAIEGRADDASWPEDDRLERARGRLASARAMTARWLADQRKLGASKPPAAAGDTPLERFLKALRYADLRKLVKDRGLRAVGSAVDFVGRLVADYNEKGDTPPGFTP